MKGLALNPLLFPKQWASEFMVLAKTWIAEPASYMFSSFLEGHNLSKNGDQEAGLGL